MIWKSLLECYDTTRVWIRNYTIRYEGENTDSEWGTNKFIEELRSFKVLFEHVCQCVVKEELHSYLKPSVRKL